MVCSAGFSSTLSVAGYTTANTAAGTISQGVFYKIAVAGNISASLEDEIYYQTGDVSVAFLVFERYSMIGRNRLGLSVLVTGSGNQLSVSAITAGGSGAVFFKINTFGEESFLLNFREIVASYQ